METKLIVFQGNDIRRVFHQGEWWFVVTDVVTALTQSLNSTQYIKKMRRRDPELSKGWGQIVTLLSINTKGGKQKLSCANTEGVFRVIQSIPSPKAEPFKRWLAKVGYERVQEIENPELANQRMYYLYRAKGYSDVWIEKRLRGMALRDELTEEYKKFKHLKHENLRDHMTGLELIFTMLGEASTTEIAWHKNAEGFPENKEAAQEGGEVAGKARKDLEKRTGKKISTKQNYLKEIENITEEDSSY